MMVIMTLYEEEEGEVKPYFNTIYGSAYTRKDMTDMLDAALELHAQHSL